MPAGIGVAHLGIAVLDQYPEPSIARTLFRKGESDHYSAVGQIRSVELYLAPGPQRVGGVGLTTRFERNAIPLPEGLYGGARRLTRNRAGAEDLVQDTIGECRAQQARVIR